MQYMLMVYESEKPYTPGTSEPAAQEMMGRHMALVQSLGPTMLGGGGLQPTTASRSVRAHRGGKKTVHDGAFAETKEQLGGYYVIDVPDLDAAIAIARKVPLYKDGAIEIRPMMMGPPTK